MKANIKKLINELDEHGTMLMLEVLRIMEGDELFYTSKLSKLLKHTWANTYNTINRLIDLGLVTTAKFVEKYGKLNHKIVGLTLTKKGQVVRYHLFKRK